MFGWLNRKRRDRRERSATAGDAVGRATGGGDTAPTSRP